MLETVREFSAARREEAGETERVIGRFLGWAREFGVAHHESSSAATTSPPSSDPGRAGQPGAGAAATGSSRGGRTVAAASAVLGGLWIVESNFARLTALAADTAGVLSPSGPTRPPRSHPDRLVTRRVSIFLLPGRPTAFLVACDGCLRAAGHLRPGALAVLGAFVGQPEGTSRPCTLVRSDQPMLAAIATPWPATSGGGGRPGRRAGGPPHARRVYGYEQQFPWFQIMTHSRLGELCLELGRGDEAHEHFAATLSIFDELPGLNAFKYGFSPARLRFAMVLANLQRGAVDEAEHWLELTLREDGADGAGLPVISVAARAEIMLARGETEAGLRLWRQAAAALRDPQPPGPAAGQTGPSGETGPPDLSRLGPWALDLQSMAVVAHAYHGRLDLVADITSALPGSLSVLTAELGPPPDSPLASWPGLSVYGSLLLALAMADIARARQAASTGAASTGAASTGLARSGARMVALAERFGIQQGFGPTSSAARARRAAQDADGPAYDDAVSSYAGLNPDGLRGAARAALQARARLSG